MFINGYFIGGHFINGYFNWWLLVDILLKVISGYSIGGYWWLFYWWILVLINGYYINEYRWIFCYWILMVIDCYFIHGYCIISYCWLLYCNPKIGHPTLWTLTDQGNQVCFIRPFVYVAATFALPLHGKLCWVCVWDAVQGSLSDGCY